MNDLITKILNDKNYLNYRFIKKERRINITYSKDVFELIKIKWYSSENIIILKDSKKYQLIIFY